jgi:uncharacterized RDD family membrane protein YckC
VKCPKCGFVSYPGITHCKKCGYRFVPEAAGSSQPPSVVAQDEPHQPPASPPSVEPPPRGAEAQAPAPAIDPEVPTEPASPAQSVQDLRQELSGRVEDFRRKRAKLRKGFDPASSLDFEFDAAPQDEAALEEAEIVPAPGPGEEVDAELASPAEVPVLDSLPLEKSGSGMRVLSSAAVEAGETVMESDADSEPMEILVENASPRAESGGREVAPLGARFAAALADGLVLALAGGLFGAIFWTAGGRLSPTPLNIAVVGFLAALTVLAYFGLTTALASATPGLLWMRLQVRNLYGNPPSPSESFWRAFGYLVSFASLLLGFVWALLDSDRLTWHDHMSGTYVARL